jgi:hypothetical protein
MKIVTHGKNQSRIYKIWLNMRYRCNTPTANSYKNYGGRGIKVCEEWNTFSNFLDWALANGYKDNLTIDRKDNDKDYCPENCQWVTKAYNTAKANQGKVKRKPNKGMYYGISPDRIRFEFENASEFAREHNLIPGCVRQVANGEKQTHKGWKFGFVIDECVSTIRKE